ETDVRNGWSGVARRTGKKRMPERPKPGARFVRLTGMRFRMLAAGLVAAALSALALPASAASGPTVIPAADPGFAALRQAVAPLVPFADTLASALDLVDNQIGPIADLGGGVIAAGTGTAVGLGITGINTVLAEAPLVTGLVIPNLTPLTPTI